MASPTKSMKRKAAKESGKPKKPTSSYFYFLEECRRKAKEEGRSLSKIAEFTRECSAEWKDISDAKKKIFEDKAAADKKRYQKEMENWTPTEEDDVKSSKKSRKQVKDENRPKRPQSAYFLFLADFRKKMKGKNIENKDLIKKAGAEWGKLSKEDKKPFEKLSEVEKGKYDAAMAIYNKGGKPATAKKSAPAANGTDEDDDDEEDDDEDEDDEDEESDE